MKRRIVWTIAGLIVLALPLSAHKENCSFTFLEMEEQELLFSVAISTVDLDRLLGLDRNGDFLLQENEIQPVLPFLEELIAEKSALSIDHMPLALERRVPFSSEVFMAGAKYIQLHYTAKLPEKVNELVAKNRFFEVMGLPHKNFSRLIVNGKKQYAVFSDQVTQVRFTPGTPLNLWQRLKIFLILGMEHIFIGYDHILFLIALVAIGGRMAETIKLITAFTIAHSITLALASFQLVSLPSQWIEALIALSIVYVAVENFFIRTARFRWILTFLFGLIHGFGFANVLQDLGLPPDGFAPALLSFNLGVEIGQILILLGIFPVVLWMSKREYRPYFNYAVSSLVLIFGWAWFLERVLGWPLLPF